MNMKNVFAIATAGLIIGFAGSAQAAPGTDKVEFLGKVGEVCEITSVENGTLANNPNEQLTISTEYAGGTRGSIAVKCNSQSKVKIELDAALSDLPGSSSAKVDFVAGTGVFSAVTPGSTEAAIAPTNGDAIPVRAKVYSTDNVNPLQAGIYKVVATATITP